jgi:hypothetical protein
MNADPRLPRLMAEVAEAFAQHCISDPTFEIGLLATSPYFAGAPGPDQWGVMAWTGKRQTVRRDPIPEGVDVRRAVGAAITERPTSNFAMWMIGLRTDAQKLNIRMFADTEDPAVLADPDRWAFGQIADYANDLQQPR